jgi:hypothetical protein
MSKTLSVKCTKLEPSPPTGSFFDGVWKGDVVTAVIANEQLHIKEKLFCEVSFMNDYKELF